MVLLWTHADMFVWIPVFNCFDYIPEGRIAGVGAGGSRAILFNFSKNGHIVFHIACSTRGPIFLHTHQHLLFSIFVITAILLGVRRHLTMVFICISLMTIDIKHLFMCMLAIYIYPLWRMVYFKSFTHFLNWIVFLLLNCKSSLYMSDTRFLSIYDLQIFSPIL